MTENYLIPLNKEQTFVVYSDNKQVFESNGHWLMPFFEFEDRFGKDAQIKNTILTLHDKIQGRAAAVLACRLGMKKVYADTISKPALSVYCKNNVECHYNNLVEKISCRTEDLITQDMSFDEVYEFILSRITRT